MQIGEGKIQGRLLDTGLTCVTGVSREGVGGIRKWEENMRGWGTPSPPIFHPTFLLPPSLSHLCLPRRLILDFLNEGHQGQLVHRQVHLIDKFCNG